MRPMAAWAAVATTLGHAQHLPRRQPSLAMASIERQLSVRNLPWPRLSPRS